MIGRLLLLLVVMVVGLWLLWLAQKFIGHNADEDDWQD